MPQVLVTDSTFENLDIERGILEPLGCQIESRQCKTQAELLAVVPQADFVITQFAPINATVIGSMARARMIVSYGIGVDNVDLDAARARGIPVCNVPDYCIDEVADHTVAFILGATRQVVPHCLNVRAGEWRLAVKLEQMKTLRDLTIGVAGCGRIGRAVVRRLVTVWVPAAGRSIRRFGAADIEAMGAHAVSSLADLLAGSDVVTLHCPSTAQSAEDDQRLCTGNAATGRNPRESEPGRPGRYRGTCDCVAEWQTGRGGARRLRHRADSRRASAPEHGQRDSLAAHRVSEPACRASPTRVGREECRAGDPRRAPGKRGQWRGAIAQLREDATPQSDLSGQLLLFSGVSRDAC